MSATTKASDDVDPPGDALTDAEADRLHGIFRDEYAASFPAGGDAQDHDEATRSAVWAVALAATKSTAARLHDMPASARKQ